MAVEGSKKPQASASQPPRKINLQKFAESRAAELESLHSTVSARLNNDFRSRRNKRRRTTAFDNEASKKRNRKRQRLIKVDKSNVSGLETEQKKNESPLPRRLRRRLELKNNPQSGFVTSGDGTKRLRTHVWHAKRFTMAKRWGFYLPLGLHGRYLILSFKRFDSLENARIFRISYSKFPCLYDIEEGDRGRF